MSNDKKLTASLATVVEHGLLELRNYYAVVNGYTRMLQSHRLGPLTELQEKALSEVARVHPKVDRIMSQLERPAPGRCECHSCTSTRQKHRAWAVINRGNLGDRCR